MKIKEPRFQKGQKVMYEGNLYIVVEIRSYSFSYNEYLYRIEDDVEQCVKSEEDLEPYVEKPKNVWDLQRGDKYYVIDDYMEVDIVIFNDDIDDSNYRKIGNCFLTKEEAEYELERRKIEAEMLRLGGRRVFKKGENNYYIVCDFDSHYDIWISNNKSDGFAQMMIYFDSNKECENAIETIGKDRIKKYIFGVEK